MASFGEDLKRERQLRDISLDEIASATNISRSFLEALEQNQFDKLPGGAYTRGFIRSYARHVGIDVDETLDAYRLQAERGAQEAPVARTRGPVRETAEKPGGSRVAETVVALSLILTMGAIGLVYWANREPAAPTLAPDPDAHGAALRARFKRSGVLPSIPLPPDSREPPPERIEEEKADDEPAEPTTPEVLVRIRARETTRVQLTCSGRVQFDAELWVGAERHFPCRSPILLSAANGGAIEYGVGDTAMQLLGRAGELVRGREISAPPAPTSGDQKPAADPVSAAGTSSP